MAAELEVQEKPAGAPQLGSIANSNPQVPVKIVAGISTH